MPCATATASHGGLFKLVTCTSLQLVQSLKIATDKWPARLKEHVGDEVSDICLGEGIERWMHPLMTNEHAEGEDPVH